MGSIFHASRQFSFNITLAVFWTISAIQLLFLAKTLPKDQDAMEEDLVKYAATAQVVDGTSDEEQDSLRLNGTMSPVKAKETTTLIPQTPEHTISVHNDEEFIISSPEYMFDGQAARRSFQFVRLGLVEIGEEITHKGHYCRGCETISPSDSRDGISNENVGALDITISDEEMQRRRDAWIRQQYQKDER